MKYDYDQRKQLTQLAKAMRDGNKLYPKKVICNLYTEKEGEACVLGCVLATIDPDARRRYNGSDSSSELFYEIIIDAYPILKDSFEIGTSIKDRYTTLEFYILDCNDSENLPILEIADKIEALANA